MRSVIQDTAVGGFWLSVIVAAIVFFRTFPVALLVSALVFAAWFLGWVLRGVREERDWDDHYCHVADDVKDPDCVHCSWNRVNVVADTPDGKG